eukprot:TRINITY_DN3172_c0_g1_i13.p1 TRINITY_DN3172_c0_g1~~TRINITY_DN3172_c0_g1_i13.p1  ORF type:complete len:747 (-),score=252.41 TRINITY_DN3172_c0_g1_i13:467-2707(-)
MCIRDSHSLMQITRKPLKGAMIRQYFDRLACIFWASENHLLHAHALYRLYDKSVSSVSLKPTAEEQSHMASQLLVATLCVPIHENKKASAQYYDFDIDRDRGLRLSSLLGVTSSLDCTLLLEELTARGLPTIVTPEVSELHSLLLTELDPLDLCARARPVIQKLETSFPQYVGALKKSLCVQLLGQLSQVYSAMQMTSLHKMVDGILSKQEVEKLIVEAVKNKQMKVRIDYQNSTLNFGEHESLDYDDIRRQLSLLNGKLKEAGLQLQPDLMAKQAASTKRNIQMLANELDQEHERVLARKGEIEERKEQYEKDLHKKEKQEQVHQEKMAAEAAEREKKRLAEEAQRREEHRLEQEHLAQLDQERLDLALKISKMGVTELTLNQLKSMTSEALEEEQRKGVSKERQEREHKLSIAAKRLDYIERARRILERPKLNEAIQARSQQDKIFWDKHQADRGAQHKQAWEESLSKKHSLATISSDWDQYMAQLILVRTDAFSQLKQQRHAEYEANLVQEREERRQRRREEKVRRKQQEERARQEAAEREEREAREAEEREAQEAEMEARLAERAEREAGLNKQAEIQRRREEEILNKQRGGADGASESGAGRWGRPAEGGWRTSRGAPETRHQEDRQGQAPPSRWGGASRDEQGGASTSRWGNEASTSRWGNRSSGGDREQGSGEPSQSRWGARSGDQGEERRWGGGAPRDDGERGQRFGGGGESRWGQRRDDRDQPPREEGRAMGSNRWR